MHKQLGKLLLLDISAISLFRCGHTHTLLGIKNINRFDNTFTVVLSGFSRKHPDTCPL